MALDDRTVATFKRLVAGIGQPDERDFARALLALDEALIGLASKVETLEGATQGLASKVETLEGATQGLASKVETLEAGRADAPEEAAAHDPTGPPPQPVEAP